MKAFFISLIFLASSHYVKAAPTDLGTDPMLNANTQSQQTAAINEVPDGSVYLNADGSPNQSIDCPCNGWYGERDASTNPGSSEDGSGSTKGRSTK